MTLWPRLPQVHLTGGEPFLHFDLLLEGARVAAELGIFACLETSGRWCTDEAEAIERFRWSRCWSIAGHTGKCHLCMDVRRHLVKTGEFKELRPQEFYENLKGIRRPSIQPPPAL